MKRTLEQTIFVGLCLTLAFTALAHGAVESWSILIFECLSAGLFLLWAVSIVSSKRLAIVIPAVAWPMAAWLVWGWVQGLIFTGQGGSRWSLSFDAEATRLTLLPATCLWLFLLIAANVLDWGNLINRLKSARTLSVFLITFGLGISVFGLLQYITWNGKFYWLREPSVPPTSPFGPFVNHNHFAGFVEMILPLALALALTRVIRPNLRRISGLATAVISLTILLSQSRGGIISMIASVAFVLACGWRHSKRVSAVYEDAGYESSMSRLSLRPVHLLLIVIAIIGFSFWIGGDGLTKRLARGFSGSSGSQETFFQNRGFIWRDTLAMIRSHPFAGVGFGAYATAYPTYSNHDDAQLPVGMVHNDYLQVVAEGGLIGGLLALCFLLLLGRTMMHSVSHPDPLLYAFALGSSGGIVAMLVHSLFDFNLQLPSNALLFLMLAALLSHIATDAISVKSHEVAANILSTK